MDDYGGYFAIMLCRCSVTKGHVRFSLAVCVNVNTPLYIVQVPQYGQSTVLHSMPPFMLQTEI